MFLGFRRKALKHQKLLEEHLLVLKRESQQILKNLQNRGNHQGKTIFLNLVFKNLLDANQNQVLA